MTAEHNPAPEPTARHYGLPNYPVTIACGQVTATVRPWYWFGKRVTVTNMCDYVAVGHRLVTHRQNWWWGQRFPTYYRQAVLVREDSRFGNIVLGETRVDGLGGGDVATLELRAMMEKFAEELACPIIDSDRPLRISRPLMAAAPDQVFETRFPEELDWSVRDLVASGRLAVSRDVPARPRGLTIARNGSGLQLTFRYSALWETLKIVGFVLAFIAFGGSNSHYSNQDLSVLLYFCGAMTILTFLIAFPIQYFFNGNELLLAEDRWTYRPASGSLLMPTVQVLSQLRLSDIEEICRSKRDIMITTDREIVRIRCRSRGMAKWLEQALLAVAAYGLSVLDGSVAEIGGGQAGARNAPA